MTTKLAAEGVDLRSTVVARPWAGSESQTRRRGRVPGAC